MYRMLEKSNASSAPSSERSSSALSRRAGRQRSRSKSTRASQSTAFVPVVPVFFIGRAPSVPSAVAVPFRRRPCVVVERCAASLNDFPVYPRHARGDGVGMTAADIGARLRDARQRQRPEPAQRSRKSLGVSPSLISQVETGKTQPSVSDALCDRQRTSASRSTSCWACGPWRRGRERPRRAGDEPGAARGREPRARDGERRALGAPRRRRGRPADALLVTYEPGASSSVEGRLMRHAGVEYAYILEGELTLQLDFDTYVLGPGDSLHFDSVRPHLYSNRGSTRRTRHLVRRRPARAEPRDARRSRRARVRRGGAAELRGGRAAGHGRPVPLSGPSDPRSRSHASCRLLTHGCAPPAAARRPTGRRGS